MSSVCGGLDYKDAESHTSALSPNKCSNNGSNHVSVTGSEDVQDSDGDDSGNIHQYLIEQSKDIKKPIPLKSSDDEGEDKKYPANDMFSDSPQQVCAATVIPAIKGSRKKHGKSVEKLRVSWAEDVYDPPPSIASHTRSRKQQQHKTKSSLKKNGKKGHKGSSSSSSSTSRGSKDKKSSSSSSSRSKHSRDKFGWASQMPIAAASS